MAANKTDNKVTLTNEQEEFLKCLENEFKDRYTDADEDYKLHVEKDIPPPPIMLNWNEICGNSRSRDNRWYRYQRGFNNRRGYNRRNFKRFD